MSGLTLNPSYYEALKRLTLELAGVKLGTDHAFLVETRLGAVARSEGFDNLDAMVKELFHTGQTRLAVKIVSSLIERDTHFFRDKGSFDILENTVLPSLAENHKGKKVRILSFGCMSGQETYGIAMIIDRLQDQLKNFEFEIVGVDYPSQALDRAKEGLYTHFEVQRGLPIADFVKHFEADGDNWRVKQDLRQNISFQDVHLLSNLEELSEFDIAMFCGNLPYYSGTAQIRVLRSLSMRVKAFGHLIIGRGEKLDNISFGFDPVVNVKGLYCKREDPPEEVYVEPEVKQPTLNTRFGVPRTPAPIAKAR